MYGCGENKVMVRGRADLPYKAMEPASEIRSVAPVARQKANLALQ